MLVHQHATAGASLIKLKKPQLSSFDRTLPFLSHKDGPQLFVQESGTTSHGRLFSISTLGEPTLTRCSNGFYTQLKRVTSADRIAIVFAIVRAIRAFKATVEREVIA